MANNIGITFLPSDEQASLGPRQGNLEGDLGQAFKILSLRLPRVMGARSITPQSNLTAPGSAGVSNPYAAAFQALLRTMAGGPTSSAGPFDTAPMRPPGPNFSVTDNTLPVVDRTNPGAGNRGSGLPTMGTGPKRRLPFPG